MIALRTGFYKLSFCLYGCKYDVMVITSFKAQTKVKFKYMEEKDKKLEN